MSVSDAAPDRVVRGWLTFAAALLLVQGVVHVMTGLSAVAAGDVAVAGPVSVVLLDVTSWGWLHAVTGVAQVLTGAGVAVQATWARYAAVYLVLFGLLAHVLFMPFYPVLSLLGIALGVVVLWALLVAVQDPSRAAA
ncbi:DUF7144 family membrane protein [Aquipuribacter sp. SD81]|uniref:DUF7144 family membrane protein n=1 Tax=Aquipuribacter sp. SD81 TaxID=3127703 RepID=UPI003016A0A1